MTRDWARASRAESPAQLRIEPIPPKAHTSRAQHGARTSHASHAAWPRAGPPSHSRCPVQSPYVPHHPCVGSPMQQVPSVAQYGAHTSHAIHTAQLGSLPQQVPAQRGPHTPHATHQRSSAPPCSGHHRGSAWTPYPPCPTGSPTPAHPTDDPTYPSPRWGHPRMLPHPAWPCCPPVTPMPLLPAPRDTPRRHRCL